MSGLIDCDLDRLLGRFADAEPAPGGGSAAALAGALAASLVCMVARITLKKADEQAAEELGELLGRGESLRDRLTNLVQEDSDAFTAFIEARRAPKQTDDEKAARRAAIGEAAQRMTLVPLTTLRSAFEVLGMAQRMVQIGNPNAITDVGVAADLAHSALLGARLNVLINLSTLPEQQRGELQSEVDSLMQRADAAAKQVAAALEAAL
ncbi:MAG: cyclodeaminase/cyclohydrolase family protein [Candidatus Alcyoniella australis]|nr:cyclodeaminase/cyclohydrolase family protein [Candidatus Alcyoniella australis]